MTTAGSGIEVQIDPVQFEVTMRRLRHELGDNGKVYRATLRAIKKAADHAVRRSGGYLPYNESMPSGFSYVNQSGQPPKANSRNQRSDRRPFPRYDRATAAKSVKATTRRGKTTYTNAGFRGGKVNALAVEMKDPAGSIFDTAGNGNSDPTDAGTRLIRGFNAASTIKPGLYRVLLPAVIDTRPEIIRDVKVALARAEAALNDHNLASAA